MMQTLVFALAFLPIFANAADATAWDSSASSGSGNSLDSVASSGSRLEGSLNTGSSASDSSDSATSMGSTTSGSSGVYLQLWQWVILALLLGFCVCGGFAASMSKKSKKKKTKKKAPIAPEPVAATAEPLIQQVAPLMPLATSSTLIPSYSMVAQTPATTSYTYAQAAPAYQTYAAPMTAQAAPAFQFNTQLAAPATTSGYTFAAAQPQYAAAQPQYAAAQPQYAAAPMTTSGYQFAAPATTGGYTYAAPASVV